MLIECLMIISFVLTALKSAELKLQITGINTFTLLLLLVLNKIESVVSKLFYSNTTLTLKMI